MARATVNQNGALIGEAIQTVCILGLIVISFVKPWGKRPASESFRISSE